MKSQGLVLTLAFLLVSVWGVEKSTGDRNMLRIHFIDVGYGDAILIEFPTREHWLIDTGDAEHAKQLTHYLSQKGITNLEAVFLTHSHKNHFGGFEKLLAKGITIDRVYTNGSSRGEKGYDKVLKLFDKNKIPITKLRRGGRIDNLPEGTTLEVFHPKRLGWNLNNNSIVLKLTYGKVSFLLPGDIGESVQKKLIHLFGNRLKADCVLVPHHGVPITQEFASFFNPSVYVISTGPSKWQLPNPEKIKSLRGKVLRTDESGDIDIETEGKKMKIMAASE